MDATSSPVCGSSRSRSILSDGAHIACAEDSMSIVEGKEAPQEEEAEAEPLADPVSLQVEGSVAHREPSPKPTGT
jgi:hypothetical protein